MRFVLLSAICLFFVHCEPLRGHFLATKELKGTRKFRVRSRSFAVKFGCGSAALGILGLPCFKVLCRMDKQAPNRQYAGRQEGGNDDENDRG